MPFDKENPIGIFDSGIGGLTVARAIQEHLPNERLIYFGDTAHLPYGEKSTAAIQAYSVKICQFLLDKGCKVIVIACHSASAAAFELIQEYVGKKAIALNVIDPTVEYISNLSISTVGLIGTRQTVGSKVYERKFSEHMPEKSLKALPTPLLVPMVEEGFYKNDISKRIISEYLNAHELGGIEALVLGCTHFPLIKKEIDEFYEGKVMSIDPSEVVAKTLKNTLEKRELSSEKRSGEHHFYVSDFTESFQHSTQTFFGNEVKLEEVPLWE
ncbi:MAG: glutamate racemase [Cytophagales bacterium]